MSVGPIFSSLRLLVHTSVSLSVCLISSFKVDITNLRPKLKIMKLYPNQGWLIWTEADIFIKWRQQHWNEDKTCKITLTHPKMKSMHSINETDTYLNWGRQIQTEANKITNWGRSNQIKDDAYKTEVICKLRPTYLKWDRQIYELTLKPPKRRRHVQNSANTSQNGFHTF